MTKFILDDSSTFSIGGNALTCIESVSFNISANTIYVNCNAAAGAIQQPIIGTAQANGSINFYVDHDDVTEVGYVDVGDSGALLFYPQGNTAGNLKISATTLTVTNVSPQFSSGSASMWRADFVLDSWTIASATGS